MLLPGAQLLEIPHHLLFPLLRPSFLLLSSMLVPGPSRKRLSSAFSAAKLLLWKLLQLARGLGPAEVGFFYLVGLENCGDRGKTHFPWALVPRKEERLSCNTRCLRCGSKQMSGPNIMHSINKYLIGPYCCEGSGNIERNPSPRAVQAREAPPHIHVMKRCSAPVESSQGAIGPQ